MPNLEQPEMLETLEQRHLIWRGRETPTMPGARASGWAEVDQYLGGLPGAGAVAVHSPLAIGEIRLLWPSVQAGERLSVMVNPPFQLSAEALLAEQLTPERWLVVRSGTDKDALWSAEQSVKSGCCDSVWLWPSPSLSQAQVRRLQLAARTGEATLFLFFTDSRAPNLSWPVDMHLVLAPHPDGVRVSVPRRRQGRPVGAFSVAMTARWPELCATYTEKHRSAMPKAPMPKAPMQKTPMHRTAV